MRTTWSLRLPGGYYYRAQGGNMSQVAGRAEILSIQIEARLDQLKRLAKTQDEILPLSPGRSIAADNWEAFNKKLRHEIVEAKDYVALNAGLLDAQDLRRLKGKLEDQGNTQLGILSVHDRRQRELETATTSNFSSYLNRPDPALGANAGTAEAIRNQALNDIPGFLRDATRKQQDVLRQELARGPQVSTGDVLTLGANNTLAGGKLFTGTSLGNAGERDKRMSEVLRKAQEENVRQYQARLRSQLESFDEDRLSRYYVGKTRGADTGIHGLNTYSPNGAITWSSTAGADDAQVFGGGVIANTGGLVEGPARTATGRITAPGGGLGEGGGPSGPTSPPAPSRSRFSCPKARSNWTSRIPPARPSWSSGPSLLTLSIHPGEPALSS